MLAGVAREVKEEIMKQLDKITLPQKESGGEYCEYKE